MAPKEDAALALKRKREAEAEGSPLLKVAKINDEETDAPEETRAILEETAKFDPSDTTLNVIPTTGGRVLMTLSEGGLQYLLACARGNVGVITGRYFFEVRIVENLANADADRRGNRATMPRHFTKVGFSTAASTLYLGESEDSICFDSESAFYSEGKKQTGGARFQKDQVIGVLLNMGEDTGVHGDTISLFKDGKRVTDPMPLPECLKGKALFPHVSFRNVSLHVNFGPEPLKALPFKCRMLQAAAQDDVMVAPPAVPNDGKFEVMWPVGVPDEGTFDWLEGFLKDHPQYVELSSRKLLEWAQKSGLWKPKSTSALATLKSSNDKPEMNFGITNLDDFSPQKVLKIVAPLVPRHYLIMEVEKNLLKDARKEMMNKFKGPHYRRVARVVIGKPDDNHLSKVASVLLEEKQAKINTEWKLKKAEFERKKQIAIRQSKLLEAKKQAEEARKKKAEELKQKAEEAKAAEEAKEEKNDDEADRKSVV